MKKHQRDQALLILKSARMLLAIDAVDTSKSIADESHMDVAGLASFMENVTNLFKDFVQFNKQHAMTLKNMIEKLRACHKEDATSQLSQVAIPIQTFDAVIKLTRNAAQAVQRESSIHMFAYLKKAQKNGAEGTGAGGKGKYVIKNKKAFGAYFTFIGLQAFKDGLIPTQKRLEKIAAAAYEDMKDHVEHGQSDERTYSAQKLSAFSSKSSIQEISAKIKLINQFLTSVAPPQNANDVPFKEGITECSKKGANFGHLIVNTKNLLPDDILAEYYVNQENYNSMRALMEYVLLAAVAQSIEGMQDNLAKIINSGAIKEAQDYLNEKKKNKTQTNPEAEVEDANET
jgi:hypothetical protein